MGSNTGLAERLAPAQQAVPRPGDVLAPRPTRIGVVIPCYKVSRQVVEVIEAIGPEVEAIYVVDDKCPEGTGLVVERDVADARVQVLYHDVNQGVGGATMTGMRQAIADGMQIIAKIDGDGQMDPRLLPRFVRVIRTGQADYAKGNRFYELEGVASMPWLRLLGNAGLSFMAKLSTGYWHCFDPTNGYFAIHAKVAARLPFDKIDPRYFFETDLLFRLNTLHAKVVDVPMQAVYADEPSSLRPGREFLRFLGGHSRNFVKRIFYNYFLRNFSVASIELLAGLLLIAFGLAYGASHWSPGGAPASAGTVMLAGLPILLGFQLLLAFINFDVQSNPTVPLHKRL